MPLTLRRSQNTDVAIAVAETEGHGHVINFVVFTSDHVIAALSSTIARMRIVLIATMQRLLANITIICD
jgi:hypothetical protein